MDDIKVNDIIEVVVTGIQKYGAFVLINNKYDGLIHISEISSGYVKNINDELMLQVYEKNSNAIKFYMREGFQISRDQVDENTGEAEIVMIWRKYKS